ncbi:ABC transporter ATP-binding protein [Variovorax sp. WS11]|uniref:ABC transporter ATP-binding protein n=1 Tax=Variovorax sp. WS11 TaxID=1105204 RepID=UPI000D0D8907|nr:ABC transporter ATP-binding protein [Variovorax sp. WS11]NDZ17465.1 ABC transporter ATP-binding protein [Variovorax sp. WS11]PSL86000.1 ABC transporter ATP-binding protein [Variovorax sp. WS11]
MLTITNLHTSYRGIHALRGVSLHVAQGEMVALIGSNGAGKSTLLNSISGVVKSGSGSISFDGAEITNISPWLTSRAGLIQVPEGRQIIPDLTVLENLEVGTTAVAGRPRRYELADVYELFPVLAERKAQFAGSLSGGQQQMLAIGRALMGSPRVLLLDEPSLGLAPLVIGQVFVALKRINQQGLTVLLVEQNARKALELTDRAYVLDQGAIVLEGPSAALAADSTMTAHYLGSVN